MPAQLFRNALEYVTHITELERDESDGDALFASSYLASHLFPKSTLARYFSRDPSTSTDAGDICEKLWVRRRLILNNLRHHKSFYELYEIDALDALCNQGVIHRQDPRFLATRSEVRQVLELMLKMLQQNRNYHLGFCREVLPFVFIVKPQSSVTIDVRNNFGYQRIQGIWLQDEQLANEFQAEFFRLWGDTNSISDRSAVKDLLMGKLKQHSVQSRVVL